MAFVDVADDGLFCPEVGRWTEEKHSLVSLYAKLFSTGMKDKWEERVYIELYAGAGHSKLRGSSRRIGGSPLRALLLEHPFDKYIFCEEGAVEMEALKVRVSTAAPTARVAFIPATAICGLTKSWGKFRLTDLAIVSFPCALWIHTTSGSNSRH